MVQKQKDTLQFFLFRGFSIILALNLRGFKKIIKIEFLKIC